MTKRKRGRRRRRRRRRRRGRTKTGKNKKREKRGLEIERGVKIKSEGMDDAQQIVLVALEQAGVEVPAEVKNSNGQEL